MIFKRRLYLQIYFTIIASLLLVVMVTGAVFAIFGSEKFEERISDISAHLTWQALPPATAPLDTQAEGLRKLVSQFNMKASLYDANKHLIASWGPPLPRPKRNADGDGWHRHRAVRGWGPVWLTQFPDGRWFAVDLRDRRGNHPIIGLIVLLAIVTLVIGAAAYPFVRRLTGRLERLQSGVEKVGAGDLATRVDVEGKDEVAQLATSFNDSTEKIEKLVNTNRQLLANASHELRTPLARVRLGVEMLKQKPDAKRQAALENDISELDQLIDEILLMSRLDTNSKPQMTENVDLLALAAEESNRYEKCTLSGEICEVRGNTKLLRRALRNLLDNAHKHGMPPVQISIERQGQSAVIQVHDEGLGIDVAQRDQVFQPFYRAPDRQNIDGYGLGLSLVKQIAEAHHGVVSIADTGAHGTTIEIRLPLLT